MHDRRLRRRPVDRRTIEISGTVEEMADAGRLLTWAAGTLRAMPDYGQGLVADLGIGHTATHGEIVAEHIADAIEALDAQAETDRLEAKRAERRRRAGERAAAR